MKTLPTVLTLLLTVPACGSPQESVPGENSEVAPVPTNTSARRSEIDSERQALVAKWGGSQVPQATEVLERSRAVLTKPLAEQTLDELTTAAEEANRAANFVGFIAEEYESYHRDNFRYEFVKEKVAPYHDAYVNLANQLKGCRNTAYLHLGLKKVDSGDHLTAFFYFRDAYRLSSFTETEGDHRGVRVRAELEMKKLMGIPELGTFIDWR